MATKPPKINAQHDYISVDLGNGRRLTCSWNGEKATGAIPDPVFDAWHKMVVSKSETPLLERIKAFVDGLGTLWPEWNVPPREFRPGERVKCDFGKRRGMDTGTILKKNRTTYDIKWDREGLVGMAGDMLVPFNP